MTRSGYTDDAEYLELWRGAVDRAIAGKRGQCAMREMLAGMDALSEKVLVSSEFQHDGSFCALGVLAKCRGIDPLSLDAEDWESMAKALNVSEAFAREVMYMNDEWERPSETPQRRFARMRQWIQSKIKQETAQ